jgi:hypothetical protein
MAAVPDGHANLLQHPLYAHLATTRSDRTVHVNLMWFDCPRNACRDPTSQLDRSTQRLM